MQDTNMMIISGFCMKNSQFKAAMIQYFVVLEGINKK